VIRKREAERIAKKLGADRRAGRKHEIVLGTHGGRLVASYGIRRGSGNPGHAYVPKQLHVSASQARELAECPMSAEQYFKVLADKGLVPASQSDSPESQTPGRFRGLDLGPEDSP
jgi:hypothetical protein